MPTSSDIEAQLRKAVDLYSAEFSGEGYNVGTFFAFAARALLSAPVDSPLWLQHEVDAYGRCLAFSAARAWEKVFEARSLLCFHTFLVDGNGRETCSQCGYLRSVSRPSDGV